MARRCRRGAVYQVGHSARLLSTEARPRLGSAPAVRFSAAVLHDSPPGHTLPPGDRFHRQERRSHRER